MSIANPVWILPGHPPGSSPPYQYYPDVDGGSISVPVFLYFKKPLTGGAVTVTLTSDQNAFQNLSPQITMTGQYLGMTLTCPGIPLTPGGPPTIAVRLTVTDPDGPQGTSAVVHLNHATRAHSPGGG